MRKTARELTATAAKTAGQPSPDAPAAFTAGSIAHHIMVLTATGSVGLAAIFLVDLIDMYFLSLLGEVAVAAAIGYAGSVLFFTTSIGIGLSIAAGALVARALGSGKTARARRLTVNVLLYAGLLGSAIALLLWLLIPQVLSWLGASGRAHLLATGYLRILVPTLPVMAIVICTTAVLRAAGDARRAMYVTLLGGGVNVLLDPLLIFSAGLGVDGAALASVAARLAMLAMGLWGLFRIHHLHGGSSPRALRRDAPVITAIALPAVLTNIATPVGNAFATNALADFGDGAVAGWAVVGRIIPVAFGVVFALSGAVGPIIGQNLGARRFERLHQTLREALKFNLLYILLVWAILAASAELVVALFNAHGEAAFLIRLFCYGLNPLFGLFGLLFVANAAFNNLGHPHYSTLFNWARATLGTAPLVFVGGALAGAGGALAGYLLTGPLFGSAALVTAWRLIERLKRNPDAAPTRGSFPSRRIPLWPFTSLRD